METHGQCGTCKNNFWYLSQIAIGKYMQNNNLQVTLMNFELFLYQVYFIFPPL